MGDACSDYTIVQLHIGRQAEAWEPDVYDVEFADTHGVTYAGW